MRGIHKDYKPLVAIARAQDWAVTIANGGHVRFQSPTGSVVFVSATPSDHRGLLNTRACLRRAGLHLPDPRSKRVA